jgi:ribosome biogenesis protein ERB1
MENLDDKDRLYNFVPKKHDCLRHVAGYQNFVKERFERCLDLYLCPRKLKRRLNIDPETLVPRLPRPKELKPFPNSLCVQFLGHKKAVSSISISPDGQYLASASADGSLRLWEMDTALCIRIWRFKGPVKSVQFNPNPAHYLLVAVLETSVVLVTTGTGDEDGTELTETFLSNIQELCGASSPNDSTGVLAWQMCEAEEQTQSSQDRYGCKVGPRAVLVGTDTVSSAVWHYKGDYVVVLCPNSGAKAVSIHQISKGKSQYPFSKTSGKVQAVAFHPSRPFLFITTQLYVKVYNLVEQKMVKKLQSGCKWLSSMCVHPSGDHVIVGKLHQSLCIPVTMFTSDCV